MKSIFIIFYRMSGGSLSSLPVYAGNLLEAHVKFNRRMGSFGCERDQYTLLRHREIPEPEIHFSVHRKWIGQLTPEDRQEFYSDRETRIRALQKSDFTGDKLESRKKPQPLLEQRQTP